MCHLMKIPSYGMCLQVVDASALAYGQTMFFSISYKEVITAYTIIVHQLLTTAST